MAGIIKLRASAPTVQKALNLNDAEFGNLKVHARTTHEELLRNPDFQWKDPTLVWIAVPAKEKDLMYTIMWTKCSCLFQGSSVPQETITRGIEQRMYDVRKNWQIGLQKRLKNKASTSSVGQNSSPLEPSTPSRSVHTLAYDPVRDT